MIVKIIDMLGIPNIMCCCLITVMLLICTITDIKKREIWPVLTISCACLAVAGSLLLFHTYPWSGVVGGLVGFVPHILLVWKGKCGGGDALMMLAAGLCLGVFAVSLLMLIATILFSGYAAVQSKRAQHGGTQDTQYPYAPFVFAAWVLLGAGSFFILYL